MANPNQEAIATFMSITGVSDTVAAQKLQEHGGNLNAAVDAHFNEGYGNIARGYTPDCEDDFMDIDEPAETLPGEPPTSARRISALDPDYSASHLITRTPFDTNPREASQVPIEVSHSNDACERTETTATTESIAETARPYEQDMHGRYDRHFIPSAPAVDTLLDGSTDIEEEMVRAAIEASRQSLEEGRDALAGQRRTHVEDSDLAHAVSLSLKTAEEEEQLREKGNRTEAPGAGASKAPEDHQQIESSYGRLEAGKTSYQDEADSEKEQLLTRDKSRDVVLDYSELPQNVGGITVSPPTYFPASNGESRPSSNIASASDEWAGISLEEQEEAVMLETAMFGGSPESRYRSEYAFQPFVGAEGSDAHQVPRPPSPSAEAQRLIREQQDEEYHASLQADREKEMKAMKEAEAAQRKMEEEEELERQLAAKEASLPPEPAIDEENAVALLIRMPDGSRHARRFMKSEKLQVLFNFIDTTRSVKPGTFRLARPYPRRAFGAEESLLTLEELGLTSKQEALFLELI